MRDYHFKPKEKKPLKKLNVEIQEGEEIHDTEDSLKMCGKMSYEIQMQALTPITYSSGEKLKKKKLVFVNMSLCTPACRKWDCGHLDCSHEKFPQSVVVVVV